MKTQNHEIINKPKINPIRLEEDLIKIPKIGDIIEGQVIGIDRSSVFVDFKSISTGIIYGREYQEAKETLRNIKIGDKIWAKIIEIENENGYIELSISMAQKELGWGKIKEIKKNKETLKVKISGANKGGLLANVSGISAFLPVSQLSSEHYPRVEESDKTKILKELQKFVGKEMNVKILNIDSIEEKLILSEKAKELENFKEILKNVHIGDIVEGEITKTTNFGAFIKFPIIENVEIDNQIKKEKKYLEGLIHISELDWQLVQKPSEIIKTGQKVKVKIIEIANNRISLSLKAMKKNPWEDIEKKYKKGDIINGKAIKLNTFGVLIQLEKTKIQALCHISEFNNNIKMEEEIKIGKKYDFKILSIDAKKNKMTLKYVK